MNAQINLLDEIIVDNFAGGGGASTGIELATGRPVTIAINHDPAAILMHKTNHPYTTHYQESVWDIDPRAVCGGRKVGLAWFSPDCKHFSKAKGGKPVEKKIRGLAWIVLKWAGLVRPRVIILENVEEFQTWGPVRKGKPVKSKQGMTFRKWKEQLADLGYVIEHRELVAADFGAPTIRNRFFLIARCDGQPIVWPEPTHAPRDSEKVKSGKLLPWRAAAEIIDWSLPCPSIFASKAEIKKQYGVTAVRPLAQNTMRRVARGLDKFVLHSAEPFIVQCNHGGEGFRGQDVHDPMQTVTGKHGYGVVDAVVTPWTVTNTTNSTGHTPDEPIDTARTGGGGGQMLVTPVLSAIAQTGGGDRSRDIREPVHTTVSKQESILVAPCMIQYHTEQSERVRGPAVNEPIMTLDAANRYGLASAFLTEYYGNGQPLNVADPLHTSTSHDRQGLTLANISKYYGGVVGAPMENPLPT
ncbi:MAG: DNA cytosine methyltransferase, partial [Butyricicoccus sp.]|nr:DNA cytosine methyltransferase [Butyricicoccus sp.]